MSDLDNYLARARIEVTNRSHFGDNGNMDIEEARLKIMEHSAQEGLRRIEWNKDMNNQVHILSDELRKKESDLKVKQQILDKYIETFGEYKLEEEKGYKGLYATVRNDMEIIMPETNSYKFYKKVFNDDIYGSFSIPPGRIINLSIEVLDGSYQILSKKVTDKKVKEEKISTKTTKKGKIK